MLNSLHTVFSVVQECSETHSGTTNPYLRTITTLSTVPSPAYRREHPPTQVCYRTRNFHFHSREAGGSQGSFLRNGKNGRWPVFKDLALSPRLFPYTWGENVASPGLQELTERGGGFGHRRVGPTAESNDLCKPARKELAMWQHFLSKERQGWLCDYTHALLRAASTLQGTHKKSRSNAPLSISCFPAETGSISDQSIVCWESSCSLGCLE